MLHIVNPREKISFERLLTDSELQQSIIARFNSLASFRGNDLADEIDVLAGSLSDAIDPLALQNLWNNNRPEVEEAFGYVPTERHPELSGPSEPRIDSTLFSIVLSSVMHDGHSVILNNPNKNESSLADNLGAYLQRGVIYIHGSTGDGVGHHLGKNGVVVLSDDTGDNLGFRSEGLIIAGNSFGKYADDKVYHTE